jgi:hypothetical protein
MVSLMYKWSEVKINNILLFSGVFILRNKPILNNKVLNSILYPISFLFAKFIRI